MATSTVGYNTNGSFDYPNGQPANQSCNNNFGNPFCFVPPALSGADKLRAREDYFKNTTLLTATMSERDFEDLVNLTTELYLETLRSDPTNRCNIDMVKLWVLSGCKTWERLARGKDIPAVTLGSGAGNTVNIKDFLVEFPKDMSGQYPQQAPLMAAASNGVLTEQSFMDWYIISKYNACPVLPKEGRDTGFPEIENAPITTARSAMAAVLSQPAVITNPRDITKDYYNSSELYDLYAKREICTPRGQTFDQVIQIGLDMPSDPLGGCLAGDEDAHLTFNDFYVRVIDKLQVHHESYALYREIFIEYMQRLEEQRKMPIVGAVVGSMGEMIGAVPSEFEKLTKRKIMERTAAANWPGHGDKTSMSWSGPIEPNAYSNVEASIVKFSLTACRNVKGFRFPAFCNRGERAKVETILKTAVQLGDQTIFQALGYEPAFGEAPTFTPGDIYLSRDWPQGRGTFQTAPNAAILGAISKQVEINLSDHLRFTLSQTGRIDVRRVFDEYIRAMRSFDGTLRSFNTEFVKDPVFGYHTSSPISLGTGLVASAVLNSTLDRVKREAEYPDIIAYMGLQEIAQGPNATTTEYCFKFRMGFDESEQVQRLMNGVGLLLYLEHYLTNGDYEGYYNMLEQNTTPPFAGYAHGALNQMLAHLRKGDTAAYSRLVLEHMPKVRLNKIDPTAPDLTLLKRAETLLVQKNSRACSRLLEEYALNNTESLFVIDLNDQLLNGNVEGCLEYVRLYIPRPYLGPPMSLMKDLNTRLKSGDWRGSAAAIRSYLFQGPVAKFLNQINDFLDAGDVRGCTNYIKEFPDAPNAESIYPNGLSGRPDLELIAQIERDDLPPDLGTFDRPLNRYLTPELYRELMNKKMEAGGWTIDQAVRPGVENKADPVGILLSGDQSYEAFSRLLTPMIRDLHRFNPMTQSHVPIDVKYSGLRSSLNLLERADTTFLMSVKIAGARNLYGYPFVPACDRKTRRAIQHVLTSTFKSDYANDIGFTGSKPLLDKRGAEYAEGRCVYFNVQKQVSAFVNREDHLEVYAGSPKNETGNTNRVANSFTIFAMVQEWIRTMVAIENTLQAAGLVFLHSERLGFLTASPGILGTGMKLTAIMELKYFERYRATLDAYRVNVRLDPEAPAPAPGTFTGGTEQRYEISSNTSLGFTEADSLKMFVAAINEISRREAAEVQRARELQARLAASSAGRNPTLKSFPQLGLNGNTAQRSTSPSSLNLGVGTYPPMPPAASARTANMGAGTYAPTSTGAGTYAPSAASNTYSSMGAGTYAPTAASNGYANTGAGYYAPSANSAQKGSTTGPRGF